MYKSCTLVANICVHANPEARQPIAIIFPHEGHLRQMLEGSDLSALADKSLPELCSNSDVNKLVLKECSAVAKKNGFKAIEQLQGAILIADEWTPHSGLVTAAQKLQRKKIEEKYKQQIQVFAFVTQIIFIYTDDCSGNVPEQQEVRSRCVDYIPTLYFLTFP